MSNWYAYVKSCCMSLPSWSVYLPLAPLKPQSLILFIQSMQARPQTDAVSSSHNPHISWLIFSFLLGHDEPVSCLNIHYYMKLHWGAAEPRPALVSTRWWRSTFYHREFFIFTHTDLLLLKHLKKHPFVYIIGSVLWLHNLIDSVYG